MVVPLSTSSKIGGSALRELGNPPDHYEVSRDRRTVYVVGKDGSRRRIPISADELERQMALALKHQRDVEAAPSLDNPPASSTLIPR